MEKNREKTVSDRPQNKHLKKGAGPGRPLGQRNFKTIWNEALKKLAKTNNTTPEEIENEMIANGALLARKGNYSFYKDTLDRLHGTPIQRTENKNESSVVINTADPITVKIAKKYEDEIKKEL